MTFVEKSISFGGIHICNDFLNKDVYNTLEKKVKKLKYKATHQPYKQYYGNRFQAYPCYESFNKSITQLLQPHIQSEFGRELKNFNVVTRKILSSELKQSKVNTPFGLIHQDNTDFASIIYFDQTVSGGTNFFEYVIDKYPDISIGAYPNRLIVYNGRRPHAPAHDFTFEERYIVASFWD